MNYATLYDVKQVLGLATNTASDTQLGIFLGWATSYIDFHKSRRYEPWIETHLYDLPTPRGSDFGVFRRAMSPRAGDDTLSFDGDLQEMIELKNGDGEVITSTDYVLEPANSSPKKRVRLINNASWATSSDGQTAQVISVSGIFGTHDRYSAAWQTSGQLVSDNPLSSVTSTVHVIDASVFYPGQLLRIDQEFMLLAATNTTDDTLTVIRGSNGTTAASHLAGSAIKVWLVQGNINQACIRLVKWRYSQKDADIFDKTYSPESGIVSVPTAVPTDVLALLGASGVSL